ncbi:MAG TPA: hypothetical protein VGF73_04425 [Chthoniobacterales bacterium]|jgi:hypothetical protein
MRILPVVLCLLACFSAEAQIDRHHHHPTPTPTPTSTPTPTPKPTPTPTPGLKPFLGGIVDLTEGGNNLDNLIGNPNLDKSWIDAFRWREHWDVVQADSLTSYDWSNTDTAIETVAAQGKKLTLSIAAGISSSPAIYDGSRPCTHFPCDTDGDGVDESDMPFPDANYLAKWDAFIAAMGAHYDGNPNIALIFVTGMGQQSVEFHVTNTQADEDAWEALALAAGYTDKSEAIQAAAQHVIDKFVAAFPTTPLLFTTGNPWGDTGGVTDQQFVEDYALSVDNGRSGICDSFLKAKSVHTGTITERTYPHGEQAINASFDSRFYSDISMPWPPQPRPIFDLLQNGVEKGDQYVEVYEYDLDGGLLGGRINDATLIAERVLLLRNLP